MKTELAPRVADAHEKGQVPSVGCGALLGSDINGRILAALCEYRKEHQAAEYPNGRAASKWGDYQAVERFRKEYCARPPTSETMAIIQAYLRLQSIEEEAAGRGGSTPRPIGVMRTIDKAALTVPNTKAQPDAQNL